MGEPVIRSALLALLALSTASVAPAAEPPPTTAPVAGTVGPDVPGFWVRPGYKVTIATDRLPQARSVELGGPDGRTLFVTEPDRGRILCLRDPDETGKYKTTTTFVSNVPTVHGLQWFDGWLWFTQSGSVHRARIGDDGKATDVTDIDTGPLPEGGGHWYRPILVDRDGFYTSIGDDGNANDHTADDREKIWHFNLDGSGKKLFCSGIRNTEKLRYRPGTGEVWGCDHGSDNWGGSNFGQAATDLNPPDEFNLYVQDGFYGHPFVVGNRVPRQEYANRPDIKELVAKTIPPAWCNGAHWANNGWTFLTNPKLTGQAGDATICFHGSWNSGPKVGYCVQRIEFDPVTGKPCGTMTLVKELAPDGKTVLGRPVDCVECADGSLLYSDDQNRRVYRLTRVGG
jgi:glucose/arabinose dehydrogenase